MIKQYKNANTKNVDKFIVKCEYSDEVGGIFSIKDQIKHYFNIDVSESPLTAKTTDEVISGNDIDSDDLTRMTEDIVDSIKRLNGTEFTVFGASFNDLYYKFDISGMLALRPVGNVIFEVHMGEEVADLLCIGHGTTTSMNPGVRPDSYDDAGTIYDMMVSIENIYDQFATKIETFVLYEISLTVRTIKLDLTDEEIRNLGDQLLRHE